MNLSGEVRLQTISALVPKQFVFIVHAKKEVASFPGLHASSFRSLAVCKNGGRRPGEFHHMCPVCPYSGVNLSTVVTVTSGMQGIVGQA